MDKFIEIMDNLGARKVNMVTLLAWCLAQLILVPQLESKLLGDHICQTEIIVPQEVAKWELKNKTTRTYEWCMSVPPRCSVYTSKVVNETEISVVNVTKLIETCCEGFKEQNNLCVSQCPRCQSGLCIKGICVCQRGWDGPQCDSRTAIITAQPIPSTETSTSSRTTILKDLATQHSSGVLNETNMTSYSTQQEEVFITPSYNSVTSIISTLTMDKDLPRPTSANNRILVSPKEYNNLVETYSTLKPTTNKYVDTVNMPLTTRHPLLEYITNVYRQDFSTTTEDSNVDLTSNEDLEGSGSRHRGKVEEFVPHHHSSVTTLEHTDDPDLHSKNPDSYEAISSHVESDEGSIDFSELDRLIFKENIDNGSSRSNEENKVEEVDVKHSTILSSTAPTKVGTSKEEASIFKENFLENIDFMGERFEKQSSIENLSRNTKLTVTEASSKHLIYSICAASLTTFLILVIVVTLYAIRNSRKKVEKNKTKKDIAAPVYTTSIFHSPLPDLPTFDNPTYLATGINGNNKDQTKGESIEVQELNLVFQKPTLRAVNLDSKLYLYDHPPSTGSYRASSEVDTLSHYNFSQKSQPAIISEPLYDEIPSKDPRIEGDCEFLNRNSDQKTRRNVDNNNLYMNTCGRTKF